MPEASIEVSGFAPGLPQPGCVVVSALQCNIDQKRYNSARFERIDFDLCFANARLKTSSRPLASGYIQVAESS